MNEKEMLNKIFEKLISLEEGQKKLEEGQMELKKEILLNRQAILDLQSDVKEMKQSMRFYDYKLVQHEKQIFKLQT